MHQATSVYGVDQVRQVVTSVHGKMAPVWPLSDYVAVNPFLGFSDSTVLATARELGVRGGIRLTMPREFYGKALESGVVQKQDLMDAAARWQREDGTECEASELEASAREGAVFTPRSRFPTVADDVSGLPVDGSWVIDHISTWAASYFDRSLAKWTSPWASDAPWPAFQEEARFDAAPRLKGVESLGRLVATLPANALETLARALEALGIEPNGWEAYLHRAALSIAGWCGFARQRDWSAGEARRIATFSDILTIRVVWDWALLLEAKAPAREQWAGLVRRFYEGRPPMELQKDQREIGTDVALQWAYERARQRELVQVFNGPTRERVQYRSKPRVQAVFCIDVRSEVYRRALERVAPHVDTLGFAGFFGFPIGVEGSAGITAQCPVLLNPSIEVKAPARPSPGVWNEAWSGVERAFSELKDAAVGSFTFVETWGSSYLPRLFARAAGATVVHDSAATFEMGALTNADGPLELDAEQVVKAAYDALRGMALGDLARLVVLVGHEAVCENNPHAAGLNCGACGGHSGAPNAQFAAKVLNHPGVRARLAELGCQVPAETFFVAAVHRTTTDEVVVLNKQDVPNHALQELDGLESAFRAAGDVARREREKHFSGKAEGRAWFQRSRDWSEPRPELGLAGCHAFVVAPRAATRDLDFGGRAFMHSYDWRSDPDFEILERIMTAPMVVTNWINLQYFASTVDPLHFGCGNKVLHNVVGNIGVVEGRGGDLRVGLSQQSISLGERRFHDPVRLNVFIAAPTSAINQVFHKHAGIRALADNGWLHVWSLDDAGRVVARYQRGHCWLPVEASEDGRVAA